MESPEPAARTRGPVRGAPHVVTVGADGARVVFLRSTGPHDPAAGLWSFEVDSGEHRRIADPTILLGTEHAAGTGNTAGVGITRYATDPAARVAVFVLAGRLFRADLVTGDVIEVPVVGSVTDARPDPTGSRIAYVSDSDADPVGPAGATGGSGRDGSTHDGLSGNGPGGGPDRDGAGKLRIVHPDGRDVLLAGEDGDITWALPDPAAADFGRDRGYWWSPDGQSILAARSDRSRLPRWQYADPARPQRRARSRPYPMCGGPNAEVTLHLLDLDGGWVDVHWDRETYPYLVSVDWSDGGPLITVLRRLQQHGLVLSIDPRTGETQVHAELADPRWVEPIPGTPCHLSDGRVLVGGELAHDGYDARCLFADGTLLTPAALYVRRVVGRLPGRHTSPDLLIEASDGEPSEQHLYRVRTAASSGGLDAVRLTSSPGWHVAAVGGAVLAVGSATLDQPGVRWTIYRDDAELGVLRSLAATPAVTPRPTLQRVTDRRLPSGVLYPQSHVAGRRLPVLLQVHGGPGHQQVRAERAGWLARQWWADAGFAVVTVDNRGTPGIAPSFEKVVHRRLADVLLADQVDALTSIAEKHPDLDLGRVAVRGTGFGGWLAGLAALRRPDVFRAAVARDPVTDWALLRSGYAERFLGLPEEGGEIYPHHSLVEIAAEPVTGSDELRPLLLVHGLADGAVPVAHTLRLSAALLAAGRPHAVLPLAAGTDPDAATVLRAELAFVRQALGPLG
ncbi:prolyl oligopeptidase family serine peptidase [Solwaraspora sp. WMMA2059]|uniref:S9 family peptidase n=1 Tax=Solwaraspora sp. WMMA2059 TaxID=3015160 RepID=UPI00248D269F|nr:prolyl oligopeptidase family serine peptidase [Solwaraspora sp. WMMA2059]WBB97956.1 prolyl oligopeptidase family serine peptidase [Solwaraspora sp. WMMA2059]